MIIRSQDKTMIINFSNVREIYKSLNDIWANTDNGISKIGTYSTEEKAIKVLDMIMEHYDKVMDSRYWNDDYQENYFIMPSDEEVEV